MRLWLAERLNKRGRTLMRPIEGVSLLLQSSALMGTLIGLGAGMLVTYLMVENPTYGDLFRLAPWVAACVTLGTLSHALRSTEVPLSVEEEIRQAQLELKRLRKVARKAKLPQGTKMAREAAGLIDAIALLIESERKKAKRPEEVNQWVIRARQHAERLGDISKACTALEVLAAEKKRTVSLGAPTLRGDLEAVEEAGLHLRAASDETIEEADIARRTREELRKLSGGA